LVLESYNKKVSFAQIHLHFVLKLIFGNTKESKGEKAERIVGLNSQVSTSSKVECLWEKPGEYVLYEQQQQKRLLLQQHQQDLYTSTAFTATGSITSIHGTYSIASLGRKTNTNEYETTDSGKQL